MRIGITGSIACGKSTVAAHLRSLGYTVVDADAISRALTADGGAALPAIQAAFPSCFTESGTLDRASLGAIVFNNPEEKAKLEQILHPMIFDEIDREMDAAGADALVFADIPLLFECHMEHRFDEVWTVTVDPALQLERLIARDHLSPEAAQARIHSQMSQDEKAAKATRCISTDGTIEETSARVDSILASLGQRSADVSSGSAAVSSLIPPSDSPVRRRRVRTIPIETVEPAVPVKKKAVHRRQRKKTSVRRFSRTIPAQMRTILCALMIVTLVVCTIFATRAFMQHQAEQRRLAEEAAERAQHPLYYGNLIMSYAARQNLDPALVAAVILCESSYDPHAESRLGARGLMQLMEDTAAWISHKLGEDTPQYSFDLLYDPETNIRFGTWYLGFLSRRYNGDAKKIVCAYHAGQGNVDAWLKNPEYSKDGTTLTTIPTRDTTSYANRVLRARDIYEKYYFPKNTEVPPVENAPVYSI